MASVAKLRVVMTLVFLGLIVVLFLVLHTGELGVKVCEANGSGGPGSVSVFPPGAACETGAESGEPLFTAVSGHFVPLLLFVVAPLFVVGQGVLSLRARATSTAVSDNR